MLQSTHLIYPLIDKFIQLSTAVVKQIDVNLKKTRTIHEKTRVILKKTRVILKKTLTNHIKFRKNEEKFRKNEEKFGKNEVIRRLLVLDGYEVSPIHDFFFRVQATIDFFRHALS